MQHQMAPGASDHIGGQLGELQLQGAQGVVGITQGAGLQRQSCRDQR